MNFLSRFLFLLSLISSESLLTKYTTFLQVKYGKVLRRFNAQVVDDVLDINIDGLRAKILSLFSIAPDSELILTYVDEDGDVVTLVDADDLRDVVKQGLNPLRITAKLSPEKNGRQINRDSGSSTPLRSPSVQEPLQNLNAGLSEAMKTVPEPLRDAITKLTTDLASKASSSAPVITELVDHLSKVGLSYMGQVSGSQVSGPPNMNSVVPETNVGATKTKDSDLSKDKSDQSFKCNESLAKPRPEVATENKVKLVKVTGGSMETSPSRTLGSNVVLSPEHSRNLSVGKKEKVKKISESVEKLRGKPSAANINPRKKEVYMSSEPKDYADGRNNFPGAYFVPNPSYDCPFTGLPAGNTSAVLPYPSSYAVSYKRSSSQNDGSRNIFHRGVRCDGCGVHPITGPRFKSKVKVDYDLCSICFSEMGNESDYIRMDRPAVPRRLMSLKELHDSNQAPMPPHVLYGGPKLDSRFIQDVNVIDGTTMAPLTPFTKIWRMRNNGMVVWPARTQLVWIGGDKLSNQFSVEVQIPADGLPIGQEVDVSVDFIAPELPGRYISYWRMASPSGQKFGQRVWVLIQVEASVMPRESIRGLNLNLPPSSGPEIINVNAEPIVEDSHPEPDNSKKTVDIVEPVVNYQPNKEHEMKFPINDSLLVGTGAPSSVPPFLPQFVQYHRLTPPPPPVQNSAPGASGPFPLASQYSFDSVIPTPSSPSPLAPITTSQQSTVEFQGKKEVEEKLLKELEQMGFKQIDLNKEILRMNEYDLEQAVDDLCGVAEWDPILEELQDMGFHDTEMNKMLLKKNNGSVKRVVMDLIAGEKI
ncbi:hypothetical protein BUALT_Bualt07G0020800 [Buddleja alternifolia]|uniref:Protein NBR1 homolog n=1 Tax=Buddleja alternifolia TaxID=168488 RepID=A0AAV6XFG4_9LAMI|nr:hypothetical protein BUALT_Bualt07G0020800 [Buddleja alternifolia]